MNITITGDLGSGKTTVSKLLAEKFQMELVDTGKIYRKFASEKGLDVLEQNNSDDWSIDRKIDTEVANLGKLYDNQIFVSRLAWYFIPDAIKIYLMINPLLAAERIVSDKERDGEVHSDTLETLKYNQERNNAELSRYSQLYNIEDPRGLKEADIVIMVGQNSPEDVFNCIKSAILNKKFGFYVDPKVLIPTEDINDCNMEYFLESRIMYKPAICHELNVQLCRQGHSIFIVNGHLQIAACIRNGVKFIKTEFPIDGRNSILDSYVHSYEELTCSSLQYEIESYKIMEVD